MPALTGQTISHFKVREKLGGGGMGVVYLADDLELDRKVALKFLPPHLSADQESNQRFVQEAKSASALNHPNVCTIYEIGRTDDGQQFIAMAHYEGETLDEVLRRGPLDPAPAVDIGSQVADGLAAAHEKGIVHRDIKPANILITRRGRAIILDFGLAKLTGALELTKAGSTLGTAFYMSPEQIRGETADHRSDLWSLGVVLYEMLTGRRPFEGDYEQAISYAILNATATAPSAADERLGPELNPFFERALQKDPAARFQDAREFRSALPSASATATVTQADPPSAKRQWSKIGLVAAVVASAVLIGLALFLSRPETPTTHATDDAIRLVVLPFDNLGPSEEDYFADGLTEELSARLASIDALAVISRSSANRFKNTDRSIADIGRELNVGYVLEGTVRWEKRADGNDVVRITPTLIRVSDDTQVWSNTYQREVEGIFEIQEDVGRSVADALNVTLLQGDNEQLAQRPTDNTAAYEAYLRGLALRRSLSQQPERAARALEEAVALDPAFIDAHFRLTHMYTLAVWLGLPEDQERYELLARRAADELHRLAPESYQDHLARGYAAYYLNVDYGRARIEFEAASKIRPGDLEVLEALAFVYRRIGRHEEAAQMMERVLDLDPLNSLQSHEAAYTWFIIKRYADANHLLERAIQIDPLNAGPFCWKSLNYLLWTGSIEDARKAERAAPRSNDDVPCWYADLAARDFDSILAKLSRTDTTLLGRSWYGLVFPQELGRYYYQLAITHRLAGNRALEVAAWKGLLSVTQKDLPAQERETDRLRATEVRALLALALAHAGLGQKDAAIRELATIREKTRHDRFAAAARLTYFAIAYTMLGQREDAIRVLAEDLSGTGIMSGHWLAMPFWDPLRSEPAFQALVERYGS